VNDYIDSENSNRLDSSYELQEKKIYYETTDYTSSTLTEYEVDDYDPVKFKLD
jgi:hypothetical protein